MRGSVLLGLVVVVIAIGSAGCAPYRAPVVPPQGLAFSDIGAPLSTEFDESTAIAPRSGMASAHSVLGLIAWGDASIQSAAKNGGLSTISYADYRVLSILFGVYTDFTVIAHGD